MQTTTATRVAPRLGPAWQRLIVLFAAFAVVGAVLELVNGAVKPVPPVALPVGLAADGRTAVRLARELRPDVVVMDIRMPVLDGIGATRQLAGPYVTNPVKVLVVTTFNLDGYVYEALRAGASGFLLKDARPSDVVAGIRTVAAGEALLVTGGDPGSGRPVRRAVAPGRPRRLRPGRRPDHARAA